MDPLARRTELIRQVYAAEGWREVFAPLLLERKRAMEHALRNPSLLEQAKIPVAYAQGVLDTVDFILDHPKMIADTDDAARQEEQMAAARARTYDEIAARGWGSGDDSLLTDDWR